LSEPDTCPACGECAAPLWHQKNGYPIRRCVRCGTGFVEPASIPARLAELYGAGYYSGDGRRSYLDYAAERESGIASADRVLRWLENYQTPGRLLEVGCAMGFFLETARLRGWLTRGVDVSEHAVAEAKRFYPGLDVVCADFTSEGVNVGSGHWDAVVALDTVEHLVNPAAFAARVRDALRPGGACVLSTGDFSSFSARLFGRRWRLLEPPEHVAFYTRVGLVDLLARHSLQTVRVRRFCKSYSLGALAAFLRLPTLPSSLAKRRLVVSAFDVMYVLARRT